MSPLSKSLYDDFCRDIRFALDALERAIHGSAESNWEKGTMGYALTQLLRANAKIVKAIQSWNKELDERHPGFFPSDKSGGVP